MRLISFKVKNFKSIIDTGECHLSEEDNVLVLAGQNEAGKSAVIEALNFFRNGAGPDFEKLLRRQKTHPEVTCKFLLSDTELEGLKEEFEGGDEVIKYLGKNKSIHFIRGDVNEDNFETIRLAPEIKETLGKLFEEEEVPTDQPSAEEEVAKPEETTETPVVEAQSEDKNYTVEDLEKHLVSLIKGFIFYDSFSDLLPGEATIADIPKYPAVLDFQKVFNVDFASVINQDSRGIKREEERLIKEASDNLNTYWRQKLEDGSKYNFSVKIIPQQPAQTEPPQTLEAVSKVEFYVDRDDQDPLYFEQKSKGFRWFSSFNLRLRAIGIDDGAIKNLIILIDEPGQGLHEKAQVDVKNVLEELASKGAQIIYTTHYPILIGTEGKEFARIRLVSNTKRSGTLVQNPAQFATSSGAKDALSPIVTAMGIHSVGSILDTNKLSVVVEGITDHYYLSAFKKLLDKDSRLYFLPACGVSNVPNLVSVLVGWGCKYKAVFDDDPGTGRRAYNLLKNEFYEKDDSVAHEHILKIDACNGIEDVFEQSDFFKYVLDRAIPKGKVDINSKLAEGKKELLARLFLDKVEKGEVKLSKKTIAKVEEVFKWLYEKFDIKETESTPS